MPLIEDLTNWEWTALHNLLHEHISGPLGLIQVQLAQQSLYLARQAGAVGYMIGSLVNEKEAELRIGREPNGDFYVVLDIPSRIPTGRPGFWEEHAVSVSRIVDALTAVSVAYHEDLAASSPTEEPF